jgi:hypothetical protein
LGSPDFDDATLSDASAVVPNRTRDSPNAKGIVGPGQTLGFSSVQKGEQPSPGFVLPSSHSSATEMRASPQTATGLPLLDELEDPPPDELDELVELDELLDEAALLLEVHSGSPELPGSTVRSMHEATEIARPKAIEMAALEICTRDAVTMNARVHPRLSGVNDKDLSFLSTLGARTRVR